MLHDYLLLRKLRILEPIEATILVRFALFSFRYTPLT